VSPVVVGPPKPRPSWDRWGLSLALTVSERADCTRRLVGAVMFSADHRILGTGYNGYPAGKPGCLSDGACPRGQLTYDELPTGTSYVNVANPCGALHAEENLVLYVPRELRLGATVYVSDEPCANCQRVLSGSGISRAVWPGGEARYDLEEAAA